MKWSGLIVAGVMLAGCGGDDGGSDGTAVDGAVADDAGGLATTCPGACMTTALTATFQGTTRVLDAAYYGLTRTPSETTIRVEAYAGAAAGCPSASSPSPDQTLILVALPIPTSTEPLATVSTLLDFEGALLDTPTARADSGTFTPVAASVCPTCVGQAPPSDPDGLVAVDASITFPTGTITGHLFASHCDSLDAIE